MKEATPFSKGMRLASPREPTREMLEKTADHYKPTEMKTVCLFILLSLSACAQEKISGKKLANIALLNKIEFVNAKYDQPKFSCGFLLKYQNDTFAVTAKHLLQIIHPPEMKTIYFEDMIRTWTMFPLDRKNETVITHKLINENSAASIADKSIYEDDFLVFSLKENRSTIQPLEPRTTPLVPGEKIYVAGWTRKMEEGPQRVYEFEYHRTIGNRILLKDIIVPEQFGGLSGAPVVDEQGLLVGIVSGGTVDPATGKKYFSPCSIGNLLETLKTDKKE